MRPRAKRRSAATLVRGPHDRNWLATTRAGRPYNARSRAARAQILRQDAMRPRAKRRSAATLVRGRTSSIAIGARAARAIERRVIARVSSAALPATDPRVAREWPASKRPRSGLGLAWSRFPGHGFRLPVIVHTRSACGSPARSEGGGCCSRPPRIRRQHGRPRASPRRRDRWVVHA